MVKTQSFQAFANVLNLRYTVPSVTYFMELLEKKYEEKIKLIASLVKVTRVTITTDYWTSIANEGYISITCH